MKTIFIFVICIFWSVLIGSVFLLAHQDHVITVSENYRKYQTIFLPQGWSFFTKNPREDKISLYLIDHENQNLEKVDFIGSRVTELMGINRKQRFLTMEVSYIQKQLSKLPPFTCLKSEKCVHELLELNKITITTSLNSPQLCGEFLFSLSERTPWAWSKNSELNISEKFYRIQINCTEVSS